MDSSNKEHTVLLTNDTITKLPKETHLSQKYVLENENEYRVKYAKYKAKYLLLKK